MFGKRKLTTNKIIVDRPEKYKPFPAASAAMYCLHRDFEYQDYVITRDGNMHTQNVSAYRFTRSDGVIVNYFRPVIDKKSEKYVNNNCPTLEQFLVGYQRLVRENHIDVNAITIVPFLQVQKRQHFNTLILHKDKNDELHVYIVEPHSNNLTLPKVYYPVRELKNIIYKSFGKKNVVVHNPTIGVQAFYDDKTCGAHHVNFTEIISHLNPAVLTKPKTLERNLRRANLNRRNTDAKKIEAVPLALSYERPQLPTNKNDEAQSELKADNKGKEKEKEKITAVDDNAIDIDTKSDDELNDDGVFLGWGDNAVHDLVEIRAIENTDRLHCAIKIKSAEGERAKQALSEAIRFINNYQETAGARTQKGWNGFFKQSTRLHTAEYLSGKLDVIEDEELSVEEKNYHAALLLSAMHQSLRKNNSELRDSLEQGLAKLLNCENEYDAILAASPSRQNRFEQMSKLFRLQLYVHDKGLGADALRNMYMLSKQISDIDSSWSYKFGGQHYRRAMDEKRNALFRNLSEQVHANFPNARKF